MADENALPVSARTIVVMQRGSNVAVIFGFLAVVFALALVRGHIGAETTRGRLVVDLVFGTLTVLCIAAWVWFHRHPARLDVSDEAVSFSHRGQPNAVRLLRTSGDLYVYTARFGSGRHPVRYLKATGSDEAIPLQLFDWGEVQRACLEAGWRFTQQPLA